MMGQDTTPTKGNEMKDDPRETDWAERNIRALQAEVDRIKRNTGLDNPEDEELDTSMMGWLIRLQNEIRYIGDVIRSGAASSSRRVVRLEAKVTENAKAIDAVSEEGGATDQAIAFHNDRISALEDRLKRLDSQTQFESSEDDARIKSIEAALRDYGVPIPGAKVPIVDDPLYGRSEPVAKARTSEIKIEFDPSPEQRRVIFNESDPVARFIEAGPFKAGGVIPPWLATAASMNAIRDALIAARKGS